MEDWENKMKSRQIIRNLRVSGLNDGTVHVEGQGVMTVPQAATYLDVEEGVLNTTLRL